MRHRNSRSGPLPERVASAVYEPVGSTPSPPHSLSGEMIALNHPNRSLEVAVLIDEYSDNGD
jgi:hypothetical protein